MTDFIEDKNATQYSEELATPMPDTRAHDLITSDNLKNMKQSSKLTELVLTDGTNDRVLIGRRDDGSFGIDVSKPGINVQDAKRYELYLSSGDQSDWDELNSANFAYSSATRLSVSNYTPADYFQIGDKIKLTQTTDKYFYIYDIGANYIDVHGGDTYTVANAAVDAIYISRLANPSGFPGLMTYTPTAYYNDGSWKTFASMHTNTISYFMTGSAVTLIGNHRNTTVPAGTLMLAFSCPWNGLVLSRSYIAAYCSTNGGSSPGHILVDLREPGNPSLPTCAVVITPGLDLAQFTGDTSVYYQVSNAVD